MTERAEQAGTTGCATNTDREIWRERPGDYYSDSVHVTEGGSLGINCGGHVIVMPLRYWQHAAKEQLERDSQPVPQPVTPKDIRCNCCCARNGTSDFCCDLDCGIHHVPQPVATMRDWRPEALCRCNHLYGQHSAGSDSRCTYYGCNCQVFEHHLRVPAVSEEIAEPSQRFQFELFMQEKWPNIGLGRDKHDSYIWLHARVAWDAWRLCAVLASPSTKRDEPKP